LANSGNEIEEYLKNRMNFAKNRNKTQRVRGRKRDLGLKSTAALIP